MTTVKATIKIMNWFNGSVLYESERETVKEALQDAVLRGADLQGAVLRGADLQDAVLRGADLRGADLQDADLRGADLQDIPFENLPQSYIDECSKDILYILNYLKPEVPFLKEKLLTGGVDGSQYTGECACLVGSLAKADKEDANNDDVTNFCKAIPFYTMSVRNPGEQWFLNIHKGDKPADNVFSKHALGLCNMVLGLPLDDGLEDEALKADEVVTIDGKKYRKSDVEDRLKELETI